MQLSSFVRASFLAAVFAVVTSPLAAQVLSIDQGSVLTAGSSARVSYSDPSQAGQDVTVAVTGGFPVPTTEYLTITLDASGKGSTPWTVPSLWRFARFNCSNAIELHCLIR